MSVQPKCVPTFHLITLAAMCTLVYFIFLYIWILVLHLYFIFHFTKKSSIAKTLSCKAELRAKRKKCKLYMHDLIRPWCNILCAFWDLFVQPKSRKPNFWQLQRSFPRWTDVNWIVHNKVALCWYLAGGGSHQLGRAAHKKCHHLANF